MRLLAVVAPAVALHGRGGGVDIPVAIGLGDGAVGAYEAIAAALDLHQGALAGRAAGRGDEGDRPAQLGPTETQGVGALPHLDIAGAEGIDALEVGEAVSIGEGHAVLGEQDAALVEALGDA